MPSRRVILLVIAVSARLLSTPVQSPAATVTLLPVADTTLIELAPTNNLGGQTFANSGTTGLATRNRALYKFDPSAVIPRGAVIQSAWLILEVTGQPADYQGSGSPFGLHRMLRPWGEGNKTASGSTIGLGQPATLNEATWNHRLAQTTNTWGEPGGQAGIDYVIASSSGEFIADMSNSPYTFSSTPAMVADVQGWLDDSGNNFGWMLLCKSEAVPFTARRFGSRESGIDSPRLVVDFTAPVRFESVGVTNGNIRLTFPAVAGQSYEVQFAEGLGSGTSWTTLTNVPPQPAAANVVISDPIEPGQRLYRLVMP